MSVTYFLALPEKLLYALGIIAIVLLMWSPVLYLIWYFFKGRHLVNRANARSKSEDIS